MSTVNAGIETATERGARATRTFCQAIGLEHVNTRDLTLLTIALAEQAATEAQRNQEFALRVRTAFQELLAQRPMARKHNVKKDPEPLVAVGPVDASLLTPQGRLDPYALIRAYGEAQTRRLLTNQVISDLKRSAAFVEARNPNAKPTSRRAKASLVDYIMAHIID